MRAGVRVDAPALFDSGDGRPLSTSRKSRLDPVSPRQYRPAMVSTLNILPLSGLLGLRLTGPAL